MLLVLPLCQSQCYRENQSSHYRDNHESVLFHHGCSPLHRLRLSFHVLLTPYPYGGAREQHLGCAFDIDPSSGDGAPKASESA